MRTGYALIVHRADASTDGNGFTTGSLTTTGGDLIVVHLAIASVTTGVLSDSKGNAYTPLTQHAGGASDRFSQLFYCQNPTVGTGHTWSISGTANFPTLCIAVYSGSVGSPADVENGAGNVFSNSNQTGSVKPGTTNQLVVAGWCADGQGGSLSIDSGFMIQDSVDDGVFGHQSGALADLNQTTAVAVNPTFSWTNNSRNVTSIATFKSSAIYRRIAVSQQMDVH